jgi:hypothetical protein
VALLALHALAACDSTIRAPPASAIPAALLRQARPIGAGSRFHPPARDSVSSRCLPRLGPRRAVHVEVFAANRVLVLPAGIGTGPPRRASASRIARARCYGRVVTLDTTGIVLVRAGRPPRLAQLFRSWRQPLSRTRLASFRGRVRVFVAGRRRHGPPGEVPLTPHAEIVLEIGPAVPPHATFTFPPGL